MHSIRKSLKMAAVDDRIKAVILRINPLLIGYAKVQEIQQSIESFRQSGKKVFAYFDLATTKDYYLATACDSIYLTPEGMFLLTGVRAELTFYRDLLKEHIGVEADFEHIGKYKNAPDTYMRQSMSKEQREIVNNIVDYRFNEIVFAGTARAVGQVLWRLGDSLVIDGLIINGSARLVGWFSGVARHVQTGYLNHYAFAMITGLILLLGWVVLG